HGRRARARHRTRDGTRHYLGSRRPPHLSARRGGRHTRSGCHLPRRAWSPSPSALTLAPRVSVGVGVGLSTAITARQVSLVKIRATCISPTAGASISVPLLREKQHAAIVALFLLDRTDIRVPAAPTTRSLPLFPRAEAKTSSDRRTPNSC